MAANFLHSGKKIVAIGRNYVAHAKELGNAVPKEPFFFLKPTSSYLPSSGGPLEIPRGVTAHHEVELAVLIGQRGRDIPASDALKHIGGYTIAVDVTARNLQAHVRKAGLPWTASKGFDTFTPIGDFVLKDKVQDPHNLRLSLAINGEIKQDGTTKDMIFDIPKLIEYVSSIMTLEEGDAILTGTPSGVGPINPGDEVHCALKTENGEILSTLDFGVIRRQGGYEFIPESE